MTLEETVDLLTAAAAFDQRTVGEADAMAWHAVLGDLDFADARTAVIGHYRDSRDRVMPADIRARVKAMRRDRLEHGLIAAPSPELAGNARNYRAALQARIHKIADGRNIQLAIGALVRGKPIPEEFTRARAALGPALPSGRNGGLTLQQIARQQVAESRVRRLSQMAPEV